MRRYLLALPLRSITQVAMASFPSWITNLRDAAKSKEKTVSYDIKIYDELSWRKMKFSFDNEMWNPHEMSSLIRQRLCLGCETKEYTVIGEAFPFPDREDSPVINEPKEMCSLLWDHTSKAEKIMVQLSRHFPPLLWHSVKPTYEALSRIFSEFLDVDALHMKTNLSYYESVQNRMETLMNEKLTESLSPSHIKNKFIEDMRKRDPQSIALDYPNEHHIYLGTVEHFRLLEDRLMKSNPFVFGWPLLLSDGNEHMEDTPLRMAAFRTVYSKSLLLFHTRMDLQVDHRLARLSKDDDAEDVLLEMPLFCTINFPMNERLCGGRALVERFNAVMQTSFPSTTPVDVLALFSMERVTKGERELLADLEFLKSASEKAPEVERIFRLSENQLSSNRIIGELAYTIIYLALVNFSDFEKKVFDVFACHPSDLIRVACGKGASFLQRQDLVQKIIDNEAVERVKLMLQSTLPSA